VEKELAEQAWRSPVQERTLTSVPMALESNRDHASQWFAVCTMPRHEKRVKDYMNERRIETFLPVYQTERQWKKRPPMVLELPLFPTYMFVRIGGGARGAVLSTPGVLSIIGNGNQPVAISETEIETLRSGLHQRRAEPHSYLVEGDRVRIKAGPLSGLEGVLVRRRNEFRVVLAIEVIMQSISVEVRLDDIESADSRQKVLDLAGCA
jgi:transcription antitermination factor NusG